MHPFREMKPTAIEPEKEKQCLCCGCVVSAHWFFNSEFVECLGKGRPKVKAPPEPYPEAYCKCPGLKV